MKNFVIRTYSDLIQIPSYKGRYDYLKLNGRVGDSTFGFDRYLNQILYRSKEWRDVRREVISRDNGFDMGHESFPINGRVIIHHMNPITVNDILERRSIVLDPEYLISVSKSTHDAIHFGDASLLPQMVTERSPFDTSPWKN